MSIPTTGWLGTATEQPPEGAPLPEVHEAVYGDGDQGDFVPPTEQQQIDTVFLFVGTSGFDIEFGLTGGGFGFAVLLQQRDAFGVVLLDFLDPPDPVYANPEEDPDVVVETIVPCPTEVFDNVEACCHVFTGWIFNGAVVFNGTRTFGSDG